LLKAKINDIYPIIKKYLEVVVKKLYRNKYLAVIVSVALCFALTSCCEKDSNDSKKDAVKTEAKKVVKLGKELAGVALVKVSDLLKDPKAFEGKTVRLSGKVEDFCHHKKAWFGVTGNDGKQMVRVFTLPRFQTPADCLGKQVVAEGKVEVITIQPQNAKHYKEGHKFLNNAKVDQPLLRPIVRAFGAEFSS
jgi:hypothetical protein